MTPYLFYKIHEIFQESIKFFVLYIVAVILM
jgi:hypothetical protein